MEIAANEVATRPYQSSEEMGLDELGRMVIVEGLAHLIEQRKLAAIVAQRKR